MSGVWRKTLVYLGLVEEPDEHDELPERFGEPPAREGRDHEPVAAGAGRPDASNVRPLRTPEPGAPHVRQVEGGGNRVAIVDVSRFDDVEEIGARYRSGTPVIIDLRHVDGPMGRRVLDFVSGVTYALRGSLKPAGQRSFLLLPDGTSVGLEERRRLNGLGYDLGGDR